MFGDDRVELGDANEAVIDAPSMEASAVAVFEIDVVVVLGPVVSNEHDRHALLLARGMIGGRDDAAC